MRDLGCLSNDVRMTSVKLLCRNRSNNSQLRYAKKIKIEMAWTRILSFVVLLGLIHTL